MYNTQSIPHACTLEEIISPLNTNYLWNTYICIFDNKVGNLKCKVIIFHPSARQEFYKLIIEIGIDFQFIMIFLSNWTGLLSFLKQSKIQGYPVNLLSLSKFKTCISSKNATL